MEENNKNKEKEMEQWNINNKGKASTAIIILLLIIIICLLAGFIFMKKDVLFSKDTDKKEVEKNTTKKEEKITFTESKLEKYVKYIGQNSMSGPYKEFYTKDVVANDLNAREKIEYIGAYLFNKTTTTSNYEYNTISEDDLKNIVEEVYGPNTYERTTFNIACGDYNYKEEDNKFYSKTGCGGTSATYAENAVTDYKATKNKLEITTSYAFFDGMTNKIYKDYDKTIALDDFTSNDMNDTSYQTKYVKDNKDKLNHIKYTFESKDGKNYYFTRLEHI